MPTSVSRPVIASPSSVVANSAPSTMPGTAYDRSRRACPETTVRTAKAITIARPDPAVVHSRPAKITITFTQCRRARMAATTHTPSMNDRNDGSSVIQAFDLYSSEP